MQRNIIRQLIPVAALALLAIRPAPAVNPVNPVNPEGIHMANPTFVRNGATMQVDLVFEFPDLAVRSTGATVLTPMIVHEIDTLKLPSVSIYGRTNWYMSRRNRRMPLGGNAGTVLLYEKPLEPVTYSQRVPYAEWMDGAELLVERTDYGCAGCSEDTQVSVLARYKRVIYNPVFIYQTPAAEAVKTRELAGRAYIDFPVNQTEIRPDYRRNSAELAKITGTIDSVKNDRDVTVTSITIKGFASPEGSYASNERLASGRTEALKRYVQSLYRFDRNLIRGDYEPEDWAGLREYVAGSRLPHRDGILSLIDDPTLAPDPKEQQLRRAYPEEYKFLLAEVYPGLRHSDYRIEYTIRTFSDPAEIREVLRTAPQKLSLNEIYLAAQGLEPGSEAYNEVFETAVRMFPGEPAANLNAANAAMQRGDLTGAARYLDRAGESPEATYARGVLAALQGDYATAISRVEQALRGGINCDAGILDHLREVAKHVN